MRAYGKVKSTFWTRRKRLSDKAKLLSLYLMSCPHGSSNGCFYLPPAYIMGDLGWVYETVAQTLSELSREGFAYHCPMTEWVFIARFLHHNPPENGNVGKKMAIEAEMVPSNFSYLPEFVESLKPYAERFPKGFVKQMETVAKRVHQTNPGGYANPTPLHSTPIHTNPEETTPKPPPVRPSAEQADEPEPGGGFEGEGGAEPEPLEPDDEPGLGSEPIPAKPPTEAWARLGAELLELAGLDDRPKPIGTGIVRQWLADWSEDDIRAAVSDAVERESYDAAVIGNLKYFEPAIRRRVETRQADQRGAAAKFWADMPHAASVHFVGKWRDGEFEWEDDKHGPAPDQPGFIGPADLKGPRQRAEPPPAPKPVTTATTWDVIGLRVLTVAGLEDARFPVPIGPVKDWMDRGWTEADIMGAVRAEVAKPGYTKPRSLKDFEVPIAEFVANRLAEQGVAA